MMTKLREFSKFFIILVAASFIGLMVFEWGMDYTGRSQKNNIVGSVNGNELSYTVFSEMYQQMYQEQRARTGKAEFGDEDLQKLRDQVWERYIQKVLFKEEMDKLDIAVSDSEVVYQIYNYPLEDFKQHPSFQTNGIFDINKYRAAFNNPQIPWRQVEQIYREQIPFVKLQNIITGTARVSEKEILDDFVKNNLKARVEYLSVPVRKFENRSNEISEALIKEFYESHKDDFKQDEQRKLSYVKFEVTTTAADTAHLMSEFEGIRKRLATGENFSTLAKEYSEDPSVKNNEGVIDYFERGAMVKPFSDAAFSAKPGDVVGPIETSYGFHLIKIEDKKIEKGVEKVKVSHVLMTVTPAPSRVSEVESNARYFAEDAKENGFQKQAETNGYEVKETSWFSNNGSFIPGIGNNLAIMNFTFSNDLDQVSGMYSLDNGYVVMSVSEIRPAGYKDLETVKRTIENRIRFEHAKERARTFAENLAEAVKNTNNLKTIMENDTSKTVDFLISPEFTLAGSVPGIGRSVDFSAAAFALEPDQKSGLIETDRAYYYLKLLEKSAFDSTAFNTQKPAIERKLLASKRNLIFEKWYEALKENADIVDNRKMFGF